jgi:hypothetical protein
MRRTFELTGQTFGRLHVVGYAGTGKRGHMWECRCNCGNTKLVAAGSLRDNTTRSCGCWNAESRRKGTAAVANKNRKPTGEAAFEGVYRIYRTSARRRNIPFDLPRDDFRRLTSSPCEYCGSPPSRKFIAGSGYLNGQYLYSGIDRVDSNLGYTLENSCPCCTTCNYAKREKSLPEFKAWIDRLIEHQLAKRAYL